MQLALAIAVALFALSVVAWPLAIGARRNRADTAADLEPANTNRAALETVYEAIRTLQVEHDLGRITDDDFRAQLAEYRHAAAENLRSLNPPAVNNAAETQP